MAFSVLLGGMGFFAVAYEERTQRRRMGALAGLSAGQDDLPADSVTADVKPV